MFLHLYPYFATFYTWWCKQILTTLSLHEQQYSVALYGIVELWGTNPGIYKVGMKPANKTISTEWKLCKRTNDITGTLGEARLSFAHLSSSRPHSPHCMRYSWLYSFTIVTYRIWNVFVHILKILKKKSPLTIALNGP